MSFATLADLKTSISSWMARTDFSDAQLQDFVALTEGEFRNDLSTLSQQTRATGTMTEDGFNPPPDYISPRTLAVDGVFVKYVTPETYALKEAAGETSGFYTLDGDEFSVLGGTGKDYELLYLATFPTLDSADDSNWLLANAPNIYLWGACKQASIFLKDDNGAARYHALYANEVAKLNASDGKAKYAGPLIVRTESYTP